MEKINWKLLAHMLASLIGFSFLQSLWSNMRLGVSGLLFRKFDARQIEERLAKIAKRDENVDKAKIEGDVNVARRGEL